MKKTLPILWMAFICLLCFSQEARSQQNFRVAAAALNSVQEVVVESRANWTMMFPAAELPEYGFANAKELSAAVPGAPIQVFYMSRNQSTGAVDIAQSDEFLIPLLVQGQARAFLTVAYFQGRFQVVSAGETNLAKDASPYIIQHTKTPLVWLKDVNHSADFIAERGTTLDASGVVFMPLFTAKRAELTQPMALRELVSRIKAMPVQFD